MKTMSNFTYLLAACMLIALPACKRGGDSAAAQPPLVTVSQPQMQAVTPYLELTGTAEASQSANLVARIPGYLQSVNFTDGVYVDKDQLLFVIEPEPYEQQLNIAQAQLLRAQSELDRQTELAKQGATSTADVERWQSERDQAAAQVVLAQLNVEYTHVTAPFSGRIGRHLVDVGNMVGVDGNTKLATLDQLVPIYVYFNLNERDALAIRAAMQKQGIDYQSGVGKVPVFAGLLNESGYPHQGVLDFVDSVSSSSTGTIQLRGAFSNEDHTIFPGVFVRVRIPLGEPQTLPVVPGRAIGNDQQGDYVLLVDAQNTVSRQTVVRGQKTDDGYAIESGLKATDRVIVNGSVNARPGDKVTPESEPGAGAAAKTTSSTATS